MLYKFLTNLLGFARSIKSQLFDVYSIKSYSQEGEDMILRRFFDDKSRIGFYVDVGAHHPKRFSNTYYFYKLGWNGINIEPNPDVKDLFSRLRGRDINLHYGVSSDEGSMKYFIFDEPALNSFDHKLVGSRLETTSYKVISTKDIIVKRLDSILNEHMPNRKIDFMTVDVEGLDLDVLKSNDWNRFRPTIVIIESLGTSVQDALKTEAAVFMNSNGYELCAKTYNSLIFKENGNENV